MSYNNIPKNPGNTAIWANLGPADYYVLSTDTKPSPAVALAGVSLEETDTGDRYRWTGTTWIRTHTKGAVNVHDPNIHVNFISSLFHRDSGASTTFASNAAIGATAIVVTSAVGIAIGDELELNNTVAPLEFPIVTNVVGTTVTLDRPLSYAYTAGQAVKEITSALNVLGTLGAPVSFTYHPIGSITHIVRITLSLTHGTAGDLGLFGNLAALTNGVILRGYIAGVFYTFANWKSNANIKSDVFDVEFDTRSGGGTFGTSARGSFVELGTVVALDPEAGDYLELLIQDNLTGLTTFKAKAQGHLEGS